MKILFFNGEQKNGKKRYTCKNYYIIIVFTFFAARTQTIRRNIKLVDGKYLIQFTTLVQILVHLSHILNG